MSPPVPTCQFEALLSEVVSSLLSTIGESHVLSDWTDATYQYLKSSDGNSGMFKLRVRLTNGEIDASLDPERSTRRAVADAWDELFQRGENVWYGFKLTVFPDGNHEIEYNYDPNCIDDPTFIDF